VDKTKANAVSQLIVALWLAWAEIPSDETVAAATRHIRRIAERYARYNYLLVDGEGRAVEHSDLGAVWSPSNLLDRLLLLELGSQMLYGEPIGDRLRADLQQYTEDPPRVRLNLLHVRASVVELPTASSDFLHVWALYALCRATQSPHYKQALRRLLRQTRGQRNPLFHAVGIGCGVIDPDQQAIVNFGLTTYPAAQLTDVPVSNSSDRDVPRKWLPRVVKNEFEREARRPLPVWRRPLTWFEWKRNQLRLDGNSGADGQTEFSGGDYLLLYWLAARHRIGVAGDRYRR
jgi:hypothetical protein